MVRAQQLFSTMGVRLIMRNLTISTRRFNYLQLITPNRHRHTPSLLLLTNQVTRQRHEDFKNLKRLNKRFTTNSMVPHTRRHHKRRHILRLPRISKPIMTNRNHNNLQIRTRSPLIRLPIHHVRGRINRGRSIPTRLPRFKRTRHRFISTIVRVNTRHATHSNNFRILIHHNSRPSVSQGFTTTTRKASTPLLRNTRRLRLHFVNRITSLIRGRHTTIHNFRNTHLITRNSHGQALSITRGLQDNRFTQGNTTIRNRRELPNAPTFTIGRLNRVLLTHTTNTNRRRQRINQHGRPSVFMGPLHNVTTTLSMVKALLPQFLHQDNKGKELLATNDQSIRHFTSLFRRFIKVSQLNRMVPHTRLRTTRNILCLNMTHRRSRQGLRVLPKRPLRRNSTILIKRTRVTRRRQRSTLHRHHANHHSTHHHLNPRTLFQRPHLRRRNRNSVIICSWGPFRARNGSAFFYTSTAVTQVFSTTTPVSPHETSIDKPSRLSTIHDITTVPTTPDVIGVNDVLYTATFDTTVSPLPDTSSDGQRFTTLYSTGSSEVPHTTSTSSPT